MKKIVSIILFSLFISLPFFSQNLEKNEVKSDAVKELILKDYDIFQYDDGDIKVSYDGVNILIMVDEDRSILKFKTYWLASDSISQQRALKLVNQWNIDKIFTTAIFDTDEKGSYFTLEYFLTTAGGINSQNLNDTLDWIFSIADGFCKYLDEEDAIK